jgi:hypothetical protein
MKRSIVAVVSLVAVVLALLLAGGSQALGDVQMPVHVDAWGYSATQIASSFYKYTQQNDVIDPWTGQQVGHNRIVYGNDQVWYRNAEGTDSWRFEADPGMAFAHVLGIVNYFTSNVDWESDSYTDLTQYVSVSSAAWQAPQIFHNDYAVWVIYTAGWGGFVFDPYTTSFYVTLHTVISTEGGGNGFQFGGGMIRVETYAIPEPATLSLLALGGVGLLARRRRGK